MKEKLSDNCPVSGVLVNENAVRVSAFYSLMLVVIGFYFELHFIHLFLAIDFALRAFTDGTYSLLKQASIKTAKLVSIKTRLVDAAPKKFAALLGLIFSASIFIFQIMHLAAAAYVFGVMLVFCALLESALAICLGCIVYTQLLKFGKNNYFIGLLLLQKS